MNRVFCAIICVLFGGNIFSQEVLNDLPGNPNLKGKSNNYFKTGKKIPANTLPFFDDFSYDDVYPNEANWSGSGVYVNDHYGIGTPSIGVATFDAVDDNGKVYAHLTTIPQLADSLTSVEIDMSEYDPGTVFITFYYQPQGNGNAPEFNDSLILRVFNSKIDTVIWYANGSEFISFKEDTLGNTSTDPSLDFKLVHLPLSHTDFFSENIRIQFKNYVSVTGDHQPSGKTNCDHWNIDYVNIRADIDAGDTIFKDMAMVQKPNYFFTKYSSVPWKHFDNVVNAQLDKVQFFLRNNWSRSLQMVEAKLYITNLATQKVDSFRRGNEQIPPFTTIDDYKWPMSSIPISYDGAEKVDYKLEGRLFTDTGDDDENNSSYRYLTFDNYYAYDDGSAEKAYGVDVNGAQVAYYYKTHKADTLRGVSFHFLENQDPQNMVDNFKLCVWSSGNGKPGELLLIEGEKSPEFADELNGFKTIKLDNPIVLSGEFFIGWEQTSDALLNVGFDRNNTSYINRLFYKVYNNWYPSDFNGQGSLMMRPIFGSEINTGITPGNKLEAHFSVYPNPTNGLVKVDGISKFNTGSIEVYSVMGQLVSKTDFSQPYVNLSVAESGVYLVRINPEGSQPKTIRLILTK